MAELFPEDPKLHNFAARYSSETFDPTSYRPIISVAKQMRKTDPTVMQSIEQPQPHEHVNMPFVPVPAERSPRPQFLMPVTNSPKRPFVPDEIQDGPPRKLARGQVNIFQPGDDMPRPKEAYFSKELKALEVQRVSA